MVSVRAAKSKGSQFEYDCQYSLEQWTSLPVTRTSERGFCKQYDLAIGHDLECPHIVIECKRLKGVSWNQMKKFYDKLVSVTPEESIKYLLFQSNRQPCLVFHKTYQGYLIRPFEDVFFNAKFLKHPSTRVKKK